MRNAFFPVALIGVALLTIPACSSTPTTQATVEKVENFDLKDFSRSVIWLTQTYSPVEQVTAKEKNPLAKKEAIERETAKFKEQMQSLKGTSIRWPLDVVDLKVDSFTVHQSKCPYANDYSTGVLYLYREAEPKIETKGFLFPEEVDHCIRQFEVHKDISPDLYKKLLPTSRVIIEGNIFDIFVSKYSTERKTKFVINLVNIKIVDVLP